MRKHTNISTNRIISLFLTVFVLAFAANASDKTDVSFFKGVQEKTYTVAVKNLVQKLKTDFADDNVKLNLTSVTQYRISKNLIGLKGEGFCVLPDNNKLPIHFDVQIDKTKNSVLDIKYDFPELTANSENAPETTEEILMQELMKQISRDYKTTNIVVSIDNFEKTASSDIQNEFSGQGEVRIGDFEWKRVDFNLSLNSQNKAAKMVKYKLR